MTAAASRLPRHLRVTAYSSTLPPPLVASTGHRHLQLRLRVAATQRRTMTDYTQWTKEGLVKHIRHLEAQLRQQKYVQQVVPSEPLAPAAPTPTTDITNQQPPLSESTASSKAPAGPPKKKARTFDPSKYATRPIALKLAYLGKNYSGFEHQPSGALSSIEEELWKALIKAFLIFPEQPDRVDLNAKALEYSKCGRTDRGVSAFGQVIAIRVRSNAPPPAPHQETPAAAEGVAVGKPEWDPPRRGRLLSRAEPDAAGRHTDPGVGAGGGGLLGALLVPGEAVPVLLHAAGVHADAI